VDEVNYDSLTVEEIRQEWTTARQQAGNKYIITPGCSVPNTSTPAVLARLRESVNA
jgi:uroporphyrinogen-III decarboxylase